MHGLNIHAPKYFQLIMAMHGLWSWEACVKFHEYPGKLSTAQGRTVAGGKTHKTYIIIDDIGHT